MLLTNSNTPNLSRIIQGLLSLEVWHKPLEFDVATPLHIALAFSEAQYVGSDKFPVTFRVNLKKATLVVMCDENIRVPLASKVRSYPDRSKKVVSEIGQGQKISTDKTQGSTTALGISSAGPSLNVGTDRQTARHLDATTETRRAVEETLTQMIQMTYYDRQGEHHWDCEPVYGNTLAKNAHDGSSFLMELKPTTENHLRDLGVKVLVRCKAEDFDITDIVVKEGYREIAALKNDETRKRVAIEVIKLKLAEAMLPDAAVQLNYADVILADKMAVPE